eukprot:5911610-Prymnesium_polylepis.1
MRGSCASSSQVLAPSAGPRVSLPDRPGACVARASAPCMSVATRLRPWRPTAMTTSAQSPHASVAVMRALSQIVSSSAGTCCCVGAQVL